MKRLWIFLIAVSFLSNAGRVAGQAAPQQGRSRGIGPVAQVKLGPVDVQMARAGKTTFDAKCAACHALDAKKIGPPLRDVSQRRAPEWIMNLLLNVKEMLAKDPEAIALQAQYRLPMTDGQLEQDQARQILEYLRQVAEEKPTK